MNGKTLIPIYIVSLAASWFLWDRSPEYVRQGGPLLIFGLTLLFLALTFAVERLLVLWRAGGRGNSMQFVRNLKKAIDKGSVQEAIESCKKQGGCLANVVGAGLESFVTARGSGVQDEEVLRETRRAIEEANSVQSPLLERNLTALSTIASIATLVGLLGTTIGMIRAFRAMSNAGAPDATQLALGISEALVNTGLGLTTAIIGTVLYNYFSDRVDMFNYATDETSYEVLELLKRVKEA